MLLIEKILLFLIYIICITNGEEIFSLILNNEIDTAKCRSSCVQSHIVKQSTTTHQDCEPIKIKSNNISDKINHDAECSNCWDTCQELSNGTSQTWSDVCENKYGVKCGGGCQTACNMFKNKSKHSNRHLTKSLGRNRSKKLWNDDRDENRVPQPYRRKPQRIRNRKNKQRRRQRTRYRDIRLDVPRVLENCSGMSWTDPTKNINFATSSRKRNRGLMYQRRQEHLHALIYILFARNNFNKWFEITQTTHFEYIFQFPTLEIPTLESLNEIRLLAVSDYGIVDQISLNISSLHCNAEESPITQSLTSNFNETNQRYRRTFRNGELDDLMEYIRTPPDRLFLPLVIGCLILALACIFILILLIFRSMFRNTALAVKHLSNNLSETNHTSNLNNRQTLKFEDNISDKDFSIFTIYDPDLIQPNSNTESSDTCYTNHTQL